MIKYNIGNDWKEGGEQLKFYYMEGMGAIFPQRT